MVHVKLVSHHQADDSKCLMVRHDLVRLAVFLSDENLVFLLKHYGEKLLVINMGEGRAWKKRESIQCNTKWARE